MHIIDQTCIRLRLSYQEKAKKRPLLVKQGLFLHNTTSTNVLTMLDLIDSKVNILNNQLRKLAQTVVGMNLFGYTVRNIRTVSMNI